MSDYNWRDHWQEKTIKGFLVEDVVLLPSPSADGENLCVKVNGNWALHFPDGRMCSSSETRFDLLPLPKAKVLRPFRDLEEFAGAVKSAIANGSDSPWMSSWMSPGMCLAFAWVRENAGGWHPLGVGAVNWQWRLDSGMQWTIDPLDLVGRPFGVEE